MTCLKFLVVVPCLNEEENLPRLLDQLLAQPRAGRVVVVDGGSTDSSREIVAARAAQDTRIQLLDNPKVIQSVGVNLAVRMFADGYTQFVRIDAHCRYPDDYLDRLALAVRESGAQSVVVPMRTIGIQGFQIAVAAAQNSVIGTGGSAHRSNSVSGWVDHGHHALMDIATFVRAGGYCEALRCNEDVELDYRIVMGGGRIWLASECTIEYFPRRTPVSLARQYFRYGQGRAQNFRRHRMRLRLRQILPIAVIPALLLLPFGMFNWLFALPAMAWLSLSLLAGMALGLRHRNAWKTLSGVAAAIMHSSWSWGFLNELLQPASRSRPEYGFADFPSEEHG